ncbi:MAG: redoxin domain-containing protein [Chloroflexi bacterium]|nr:redoxin domain-containing protein [Chloroflexota bacterium]
MNSDVSIGLAFLAGLVSFISPCVLPLVPAYVGYMGGRATTQASGVQRNRFGTFLHGIFFVLGFTVFFVGFGLITAAAASFLDKIGLDVETILIRLGGIAVILFGLYVMKALDPVFAFMLRKSQAWEKKPLPALLFTVAVAAVVLGYFYWAFGAVFWESAAWALILLMLVLVFFRQPMNEATSLANFWTRATEKLQVALISDTRNLNFQPKAGAQGYLSSMFMGIVFSAGWTPCIGPVYGAVLTLANDAAQKGDSLWPAGTMLTAYSFGLGIPFLLTALALNQATGVMRRLKRNMLMIERVSGILLLIIGFSILSGGLNSLNQRIAGNGDLGSFSVRLEACTTGLAEGRLSSGRIKPCLSDGYEKINDQNRFIRAVDKGTRTDNISYVFPTPENYDSLAVGLEIGNRAPEFEVETIDGDKISLSDLRGQPVLINFWATWCQPCRKEMPEIEQVYQIEQKHGFRVLTVNLFESKEQINDFLKEFDLSFTFALDEKGEINGLYNAVGLPTSYLIDGNGIIVDKKSGPISAQWLFDHLSQFATTSTETALSLQ